MTRMIRVIRVIRGQISLFLGVAHDMDDSSEKVAQTRQSAVHA